MKVRDDATECALNLRVLRWCDFEPVADNRGERHVSVVVNDKAHE